MVVSVREPSREMSSPPASPLLFDLYRLSVERYHQIVAAGLLTEDDRVELLEGYLAATMPKKPWHRIAKRRVMKALAARLPAGWFVEDQEPITTADSEPEPDVMVVRGDTDDYRERHPGPQDVALVVEISDSTLANDRSIKKRIYARAGIPAYWIVNLPVGRLEVYGEPTGASESPDYAARAEYGPEDEVELVIGGQAVGRVTVRDLLP